jgi:hypothetical protein
VAHVRLKEVTAFAKTEREKRKFGGGGVIETEFAVLKVPRQCPLVLLVEVRLVCGIDSILI